MAIVANKISSKFFTYTLENKTLTADASDLTGQNFSSRLYDDACDVGFIMVSAITQNEVMFHFVHKLDDGEEMYGWEFHPTIESVKKYPNVEGVKVLIFND